MPFGRLRHNAALLHDGRVLIAGGVDENGQPVLPAAIFDPTTFDPTTPVDSGAEDPPDENPTHEPGTQAALHLGCALGADGSTPTAWSAIGLLAALALRRRRA
jgi:MYXO-CTERM domain-containing protein